MAQASEPAAADDVMLRAFEAFMAAARAGDCLRVSQALQDLAKTQDGKAAKWDDDSSNTGSEVSGSGTFLINGTPLFIWAVEQPDVPLPVVQLLLEEGAEIDLPGPNCESALLKAVRRGYEELVELLLERGADVHVENNLGHSPLTLALMEGHLPIVRMLLSGRIKCINDVSCRLQTALGCAVSRGYVDVARVLLRDHGANPIYCAAMCEPKAATEGADIEAHHQCFEMIKVRPSPPRYW
jgi:hypothetical protein